MFDGTCCVNESVWSCSAQCLARHIVDKQKRTLEGCPSPSPRRPVAPAPVVQEWSQRQGLVVLEQLSGYHVLRPTGTPGGRPYLDHTPEAQLSSAGQSHGRPACQSLRTAAPEHGACGGDSTCTAPAARTPRRHVPAAGLLLFLGGGRELFCAVKATPGKSAGTACPEGRSLQEGPAGGQMALLWSFFHAPCWPAGRLL